jgi:hypothetical protein
LQVPCTAPIGDEIYIYAEVFVLNYTSMNQFDPSLVQLTAPYAELKVIVLPGPYAAFLVKMYVDPDPLENAAELPYNRNLTVHGFPPPTGR